MGDEKQSFLHSKINHNLTLRLFWS